MSKRRTRAEVLTDRMIELQEDLFSYACEAKFKSQATSNTAYRNRFECVAKFVRSAAEGLRSPIKDMHSAEDAFEK